MRRQGRSATLIEAMPNQSGYDEMISVPKAVRFPLELRPPSGFDDRRPETWPKLPGRLEFVDGKLLFMPPCGDLQQYTVTDLVITLGAWVRAHPDFVLGTNEAGMRLRGSTRAADAAIWRRADTGAPLGVLQRTAPVLAAEVAGDEEEPEPLLRDKARWYLDSGVQIVWILLPDVRELLVITAQAERRFRTGERVPEDPLLAGLAPTVAELFTQISTWSS
ncbi:MAG: Uma2 family endonuclease [Myxococcaceae bacterium]